MSVSERLRVVGGQLIERLLIEGVRRGEKPITIEDIEDFVELEKSATFRRAIIVELIISLRDKLIQDRLMSGTKAGP